MWRFKMRSRIRNSGVKLRDAKRYLDTMDEGGMEHLVTQGESEEVQALDNLLFDKILEKLKGKLDSIVLTIMEKCEEGCGRQAYRVLEEEFRYEAGLLATDAGTEIVNRSPNNMDQLEDFNVKIKHDLAVLEQTEGHQPLSMTMQLVKEKLKPYDKDSVFKSTSAVFEKFEADGETSLRLLLDRLKLHASNHNIQRARDKRSGKSAAFASTNPDKDKTCDHCGKQGHVKKSCFLKHPELRTQKGGKGKGDSRSPAAAASQVGAAYGGKKGGGKGGDNSYKGGQGGGSGKWGSQKGNTKKGAAAGWNQGGGWPQGGWSQGGTGQGGCGYYGGAWRAAAAQGGPGKGKGGGAPPGSFPPCPYCQRDNHPPEECFYNPTKGAYAGNFRQQQQPQQRPPPQQYQGYYAQGAAPPAQQYAYRPIPPQGSFRAVSALRREEPEREEASDYMDYLRSWNRDDSYTPSGGAFPRR